MKRWGGCIHGSWHGVRQWVGYAANKMIAHAIDVENSHRFTMIAGKVLDARVSSTSASRNHPMDGNSRQ